MLNQTRKCNTQKCVYILSQQAKKTILKSTIKYYILLKKSKSRFLFTSAHSNQIWPMKPHV